jgi:hypothetical protein
MSYTTIDSVILDIIKSTRDNTNIFSNEMDALCALLGRSDPKYTLSYKKVINNNATDYYYRIWDITVGFLAETDASFDMIAEIYYEKGSKYHISIPFNMKAGDFQLIWHNTNVFSNILFGFHNIWFKNVKGDVKIIGCYLNNILRSSLSNNTC